ncbi:MAG: fumarylacetoacetate hydrolase family protein, partial [Deltaproteobacteria bacterium]
MIFGRARIDGAIQLVRVEGDTLHLLEGDLFAPRDTGRTTPRGSGTFVAPVRPGKIVCVGRNYRAHARELGNAVPSEPLLFIKPPSAVIGPDERIVLPRQSQRVEHEGELAVVLGRTLHEATSADEVRAAILGYTCANDVTARDLQKKDTQFTRAKGFDTFCPLGPWITTERPGADARVTARVNGEARQHGSLSDMVFG